MKYFDSNSDRSRVDDDVEPLVHGILENTQIFGPDTKSPPRVTSALKYVQEPQKRRSPGEYKGDDEFIENIIDIFGFEPLNFQQTSWDTVRDLNERRRGGDSQGAIFSAPTGFGKTEAFLGPLYQLLQDDDLDRVALVYPSKALLQDQLGRVLKHLHTIKTTTDEQLSVGVWSGDTAYKPEDVSTEDALFEGTGRRKRFRLANCWCGDHQDPHAFQYEGGGSHYDLVCEHDEAHRFSDREVVLNREDIRRSDGPDIVLTTLESLELFGLKPNYSLIDEIDAIVFDEVHLYTGIRGAHAANIIENIEEITDHSTLWLGASATVDDAEQFAAKIFPIPDGRIRAVSPPDEDFATDHNDKEHYFFLKATEDGPGVSSMFIQQILLLGHAMLQQRGEPRGKVLSFIDSISQVNQKRSQLEDADRQRDLWRYHTDIDEPGDWREVANGMDREFVEGPLNFSSVFSDVGFDASVVQSDVLLSTNFLEVGIDVGDISIVTQYRTPWNLSSFVQRVGRAARESGTDSFIFVFLSDLTSDANMFYRADRFLGSEIRTPLKSDNEVIDWIHERYREFYEVSSRVRDRHHYSTSQEKTEFHKEYLVDELGWESYHTLISDPQTVLSRELGMTDSFSPLTGQEPITHVLAKIESREEEIQRKLGNLGLDGDSSTGNTAREMVEGVREDILSYVQERVVLVEQCREHDDPLVEESVLDRLEEVLVQSRDTIADSNPDPMAELDHFRDVLPLLYDSKASVLRIKNASDRDDIVLPRLNYDVGELEDAVERVADAADDGRAGALVRERKRIYYLKQSLEELYDYQSIQSNILSLYYVKHLLRGAYYYDRFLQVNNDSLGGEVWYVPENYFDDAGQYFTVFHGKNDTDGSDQSIDTLVHSYAPFRSEYKQEAGRLQAFVPETVVEDDTVRFVFEDVPGERRDGLIIPDSIRLDELTDLSGSKALNIVRYCPQCLQILDQDSCLRHNDSAYGKIHASPDVETDVVLGGDAESQEISTLSDVSGEIRLSGASLEITPATYARSADEYIFTGGDRIERSIKAPEQTLGFELDTRGITFDVSGYLERIDDPDVISRVDRYKNLSEVGLQEIGVHTAAHFFTQLVADVAGVTPGSLFYGVDSEEEVVYVFERSQGGQGLVDMVFEDFQEDPGTTLESATRITYDPQVICERLWADKDFIDKVSTSDIGRAKIEEIVRKSDEVPVFEHVVEQVVEEVQSSIDRARQLVREENISVRRACTVKHVVASARIDGDDTYPEEKVNNHLTDFDNHERVKALFFSPNIDGCVENLQLSECISGHDQSDTLSYVLLEELREELIQRVEHEDLGDEIFDREVLPGGEYDGTSIFLTL
ncbi:dead/deah box helicase [Halorubrum coriense DSM 10284]|uniref:Dead/deah box helicase n=2 Tax=Halorubrum coriense TaxID=64713 RepID=M0EM10_9EURY|nr:dead/deah box helicase [Halorubrum coriense DSM 10284]